MSEDLDILKSEFLEQTSKVESLEEQLVQARQILSEQMAKLGVGTYVQDPYSLAVYRITVPKGRFVFYSMIDYVRTAFEGEKQGSLSKKEAEAQGFTLSK